MLGYGGPLPRTVVRRSRQLIKALAFYRGFCSTGGGPRHRPFPSEKEHRRIVRPRFPGAHGPWPHGGRRACPRGAAQERGGARVEPSDPLSTQTDRTCASRAPACASFRLGRPGGLRVLFWKVVPNMSEFRTHDNGIPCLHYGPKTQVYRLLGQKRCRASHDYLGPGRSAGGSASTDGNF